MGIWSALWRRLGRRPKEEPQQPTHLGGRGIPRILGVCQGCGAVVVEGLHHTTPTGFLCQRCANAGRRQSP